MGKNYYKNGSNIAFRPRRQQEQSIASNEPEPKENENSYHFGLINKSTATEQF